MEGRNIILIMNDDLAQWALGSYGNQDVHSPTIDYLAGTGVQMNNAFTPIPVCSPARACCLTGRLPSQHGIHDYLSTTIPDIHRRQWLQDEITLPQMLSQAGYQTAHCGKWHLGNDDQPQPGYDYWFSGVGDYPSEHSGSIRYCDNGTIRTISGYKTQVVTDAAIDFLRKREPERPFFLDVGYTATHNPWRGHPERLVSYYRNRTFEHLLNDVAYPFGRQNLESTLPTRLNPREALAQYHAAITHIDEAVGCLLDELEALELRESTLLVFTSDHGLCTGHHGLWGKGNATIPLNMLEESIRIPMIFNQSGRLFGYQRRREFVDHLDLFQTLADFAGASQSLPEDKTYPGRSFLPLLDNSDVIADWRTEQFGEYGNLRMIRTGSRKLVRRYPDGPHELFDLCVDSQETVNLFEDPAHQSLVNELTMRLDAHFGQYEDSIKSGLRVRDLPEHNTTEAWRVGNTK